MPVAHGVEAELFSQRGGVDTGDVRLVAEHQQGHVLEGLVAERPLEGLLGQCEPGVVAGVDHVDDCICVLEVVVPEGADVGLPADVPGHEFQSLVGHCLHVEPDRGHCVDQFSQSKVVEDCGLARPVQSYYHQPFGAALSEHLVECLCNECSHVFLSLWGCPGFIPGFLQGNWRKIRVGNQADIIL